MKIRFETKMPLKGREFLAKSLRIHVADPGQVTEGPGFVQVEAVSPAVANGMETWVRSDAEQGLIEFDSIEITSEDLVDINITLTVPEGSTEEEVKNAIAQGARELLSARENYPMQPKSQALYLALNNTMEHYAGCGVTPTKAKPAPKVVAELDGWRWVEDGQAKWALLNPNDKRLGEVTFDALVPSWSDRTLYLFHRPWRRWRWRGWRHHATPLTAALFASEASGPAGLAIACLFAKAVSDSRPS